MSELINIAARLARCQPLYLLDEILEDPTRLNRQKLREALYAAENALKEIAIQLRDIHNKNRTRPAEALPEPVGVVDKDSTGCIRWREGLLRKDLIDGIKLYTSPNAANDD